MFLIKKEVKSPVSAQKSVERSWEQAGMSWWCKCNLKILFFLWFSVVCEAHIRLRQWVACDNSQCQTAWKGDWKPQGYQLPCGQHQISELVLFPGGKFLCILHRKPASRKQLGQFEPRLPAEMSCHRKANSIQVYDIILNRRINEQGFCDGRAVGDIVQRSGEGSKGSWRYWCYCSCDHFHGRQ